MDISAIILAKNEENNIKDCIATLSFCQEIIVIDDNSTDKTANIAKKLGAKVITHGLGNDFSSQRNFAMTKAKHLWILFIDADERVTLNLKKEILEKTKHPTADAYYLPRIDYMWGKLLKHGEVGNIYILRLARKDSGAWVGAVHENWITQGKTAELKAPLLHYPHVNTEEFLKEINHYSTIRAQELFEQKIKLSASWRMTLQILAYPIGKFLRNYILRLGFMDGIPGFVLAMLMSFHSFLVRAKLWQLQEKAQKKT